MPRQKHSRAEHCPPRLEVLEDRRLLSGGSLIPGVPFQVNSPVYGGVQDTTILPVNYNPRITVEAVANTATGSVVVWSGNGPGDPSGIFAQRYDANGTPDATGEFRVNMATTAGDQTNPVVAGAASADIYAVAWNSDRGVNGKLFKPGGSSVEFQVVAGDAKTANYVAAIAMDAAGDSVIMYHQVVQKGFSETHSWYAQRYSAAGQAQGKAIKVATPGLINGAAGVAMDAQANFVVAWDDGQIYAQRYSARGAAVGSRITVNTTPIPDAIVQWQSNVTMDAQGNFLVTWAVRHQAADGSMRSDRAGQLFDAGGARRGGQLSFSVPDEYSRAVTMQRTGQDAGAFTLTWSQAAADPGHGQDVWAQRFDRNGLANAPPFPVSADTTPPSGAIDQVLPSVAVDGSGNVLVVWNNAQFQSNGPGTPTLIDSDVFARRYVDPPAGALDTTLDTTFGPNADGKVTTAIGTRSEAIRSLAVQPDGKLLAAGYTWNGNNASYDFAVVRYNSNGSLDTSFANAGKAVTSMSNGDDIASGMLVQPDGKIVVVGSTFKAKGWNSDSAIAVVRYNPNGTLDTTFDRDGEVTTSFSSKSTANGYAVALQSDGKIIVAGSVKTGGGQGDVAVVRYNRNGSLDTTFGKGGLVSFDVASGSDDSAIGVAVQPDGKIVLTGTIYLPAPANSYAIYVARLNPNGTLDTTFDGDGKAVTTLGQELSAAFGLALQPDGKIVVVGHSFNGNDPTEGGTGYDVALARFNGNGTPDSTFGGDGLVTVDFDLTPTLGPNVGTALALQPDGKILVAGYTGGGPDPAPPSHFGLLRLNGDGSLDTGFGTNGAVVTAMSTPGGDAAYAVVVQADGKIVVGGAANGDFALARYLGDSAALAAGSTHTPSMPPSGLVKEAVPPLVPKAVQRGHAPGLTAAPLAALPGLSAPATDLGGAPVGLAPGSTIGRDDTAVGWLMGPTLPGDPVLGVDRETEDALAAALTTGTPRSPGEGLNEELGSDRDSLFALLAEQAFLGSRNRHSP
jgi:uncharacterized delta-60 repeat protein